MLKSQLWNINARYANLNVVIRNNILMNIKNQRNIFKKFNRKGDTSSITSDMTETTNYKSKQPF